MFGIKKQEIVFAKEFLIHLQTLQRTEDEIHEFSKNSYTSGVKKKAQQRDLIARELKGSLLRLEEDIRIASNGNGPEDKLHFLKIKNLVYNIEDLLKIQLEELNKIEILEDHLARTMAIDGVNMSGESQLTYEIKKLRELLDSQEQVIAKYIVETEQKLEEESKTTSNPHVKEDNRPEEIKKRFILSEDGETIYDNQTKLTWERDWTKRDKLDYSHAKSSCINGFRLPSTNDFRSLNIQKRKFLFIPELKMIGFYVHEDVNLMYWTNEERNLLNNEGYIITFEYGESASILARKCNIVCVKQN